jgi:hypothetical protein
MGLLDSILTSSGGPIAQIGKKLGLPEELTEQAAKALMPALARGLQKNASQPGGLDSLLGALGSGNHQKYVDQPEQLGDEESIADGNAILGHVFGNKDVSRNVAGAASQETGIDTAALKKMLPMPAGVAMGALSKQTNAGQQLSGAASSGNPLDSLSSILGGGEDGGSIDDLLNLTKKYI